MGASTGGASALAASGRSEASRECAVRPAGGRSAQPDVRHAGPSLTSRLLPPEGEPVHDLFAHVDRFGRLPYRGGRGLLIPDVDAGGRTGPGGAGVATAAKV